MKSELRKNTLDELIRYPNLVDNSQKILMQFEWDCNKPLAIIHLTDIIGALKGYLDGDFSEKIIENWANAIECREDIEFEKEHSAEISELIFELANPSLTNRLTISRAACLLEQFGS